MSRPLADPPSTPASTPAATVVPLREPDSQLEVLLLRRNSRGPFGGMWVFPGGKVDPADWTGSHAREGEPDELAAARRAAVREAFEEAQLSLDPAELVALSFWMPPPEAPRRFATWFFLAPVRDNAEVTVDLGEIHAHRWVSPAGALQLRDEGEINLAPPTYMTLWWLSHHVDVAGAMAAAAAGPVARYETHVAAAASGDGMTTTWAGDAGYEDGDLQRPGPRRRLIMDPAGWRVEIAQ